MSELRFGPYDILQDRVTDLRQFYASLHAVGGIFKDAHGVHVVAQYASIIDVLNDPRFVFSCDLVFENSSQRELLRRSGFPNLIMFQSGAAHLELRRVLIPLFSPSRLSVIQERLNTFALMRAVQLAEKRSYEFVSEIGKPLATLAVSTLIGLSEQSASELISEAELVRNLVAAVPMEPKILTRALADFSASAIRLGAMMDASLVKSCTGHPAIDLWRVTDPEKRHILAGNLLLLLLTGFDTLHFLLSNAAAKLLAHSALLRRSKMTPSLLRPVIDELLRLVSPGQIVFRHAIVDAKLGDHAIQRGDQVALLIGAGNLDPNVFPHPAELDPTRSRTRALAFGAGMHACIGAALARLGLTTLIEHLSDHLCSHGLRKPIDQQRQHGLLRGFDTLVIERVP